MANNVTVGKPKIAGAIFRAPAGTTVPTTADGTLDNAFINLGFVSEDGVTNSNTAETENIKEWGGQVVLVVTTEKPDTFQLTLIDTLNADVAKAVYGDANVATTTGGFSITANATGADNAVYVIDMAMTGGALRRIVIPVAQLGEVGDIVYKSDEAVGYEITLNALPDASGNTHYEYVKLA